MKPLSVTTLHHITLITPENTQTSSSKSVRDPSYALYFEKQNLLKTCPLYYEISLISHCFTREEHRILQEKWRQRQQKKRGVYVTSLKKPFTFRMQETSKVTVQNSFKLYCFEYFIKTLDWDRRNKMTMHWQRMTLNTVSITNMWNHSKSNTVVMKIEVSEREREREFVCV